MAMDKKWVLAVTAALALAIAFTGAGVIMATSQVNVINVPYVNGQIPLDPGSQLWAQAEKTQVPLVAQLSTYPTSIDVKARSLKFATAYNGTHFAIYMEWDDQSKDVEDPTQLNQFSDAVAVQFPAKEGEEPYVCMGDTASPVNIVLWKAGKGEENLVAGSAYGKTPEEREALGLHGKPTSPIELLPRDAQVWSYNAVYEDGKWKVVLVRPTGSSHPLMLSLKPGQELSVAFARWEGSSLERGGAKTTSGWYMIKLEEVKVAAPQTVTQTVTQTATETVTQTQEKTVTTTVTEVTTTPAVTGAVKGALAGLVIALIVAIIVIAMLFRKGAFSK